VATITEVREAIAAAVETIDGLRAVSYVADQVNPPVAHVYRKGPIVYDEVQHGPGEYAADTLTFGVQVYASRTSDRVGQDLLDGYAEQTGDTSIKETVESDAALTALVDWALVTDVGPVEVVTIGAIDYYREDFTVQVGVS
jgi:hypothetical protein